MKKTCAICGKEFESTRKNKTCSPECAHQSKLNVMRSWRIKHKAQKAQEILRKPKQTICQVTAMAKTQGVSYGKMVQLLENGLQTVSGKEKAVDMG